MASAARTGILELSITSRTLRGTVAGTALCCSVHLDVGLGGRVAAAEYALSPPTLHRMMGTVAYATVSTTGTPGGPGRGKGFAGFPGREGATRAPAPSSMVRGGGDHVWFEPGNLRPPDLLPSWDGETPQGASKGEIDRLRWSGLGIPSTLVFTSRSGAGGNDVVVVSGFDSLMSALKAAGGCALHVRS